MNLTVDQLQYVLERKYQGIRLGVDVVVVGTVTEDVSHPEGFINNPDAKILEWKIDNVPQPDDAEIDRLWGILKDQYDVEGHRIDSQMYQFIHYRDWSGPTITINEDL